MRNIKKFYCLLLTGLLISPVISYAQLVPPVKELIPPAANTPVPPVDSLRLIEILPGVRKLEFRKLNDSTQLQILAGNVKLKQKHLISIAIVV